jgi:hypothetical protein
MSEAPKKIWRVEQNGYASGPDVPYIRADLVDGLVEALEKLAKLGNGDQYGNSIGNEIARAALKALEEE